MDAYVTFFQPRGQSLYVDNGFSFCRFPSKERKDIFVDCLPGHAGAKALTRELSNLKPDRIFASFSFDDEWNIIKEVADPRWIIGGPMASIMKKRGMDFVGELIAGPMETHLGISTSSTFDPYFVPFVKRACSVQKFANLSYNCSLSKSCYWRKCEFCNYHDFEGEISPLDRGDVVNVLKNIPSVQDVGLDMLLCHLCVLAVTARQLEEVSRSEKKGNTLVVFVRADKGIVEKMKSIPDMSGVMLKMGAETFSQAGIDVMNKGIHLPVVLDMIRVGLAKNAKVSYLTIEGLPFLTRGMVEESIATIAEIKKIVAASPCPGNFSIFLNPIISWSTEEKAARFGKYFPLNYVVGGFCNVLSPEVKALNQEIHQAVVNSGLTYYENT